jgi:hypothetical protein
LTGNIKSNPCLGFENETAMVVAQVIHDEINFLGKLVIFFFNEK